MTDYRKLDVYAEARELARDLFQVTSRLPLYLRWRLGGQLDAAVDSIKSNLAEGHGRKNISHGNAELIRYGHMAFGSACEVECRIEGLHDRDLITDADNARLSVRISRIKGMLLSLIRHWKHADRGRCEER